MRRLNRSRRPIVLLGLLGLLSLGIGRTVMARRSQAAGSPPNATYETQRIEGWTVLVNRDFLQRRPGISERTLALLRFQLYQIVRRVPSEAVKKLRTIRIWVEEDSPTSKCMSYHPDPRWLESHGGNPAKGRCIELAKARTFLDWTLVQPWMVLHELAHAYHHQFLEGGFKNPEIQAAYDRAMAARIYENVLYFNGREQKAYAANNPMEYFAEATEAFFGTNDYFPFVRAELRRHDPGGYDVLSRLWRVPEGEVPHPARRKPAGPEGAAIARDGPPWPAGQGQAHAASDQAFAFGRPSRSGWGRPPVRFAASPGAESTDAGMPDRWSQTRV